MVVERRAAGGAFAFALAAALILVGRYALAQHEDPGALFYIVAPVCMFGGAAAAVAGLALLERHWRPVAAAVVAIVAGLLAANPGTSDGEHAFAFVAAGVAFSGYALLSAVRVRRDDAAPSTARAVSLIVIVVAALGIAAAIALAAIVLLFILTYEGES